MRKCLFIIVIKIFLIILIKPTGSCLTHGIIWASAPNDRLEVYQTNPVKQAEKLESNSDGVVLGEKSNKVANSKSKTYLI